MFDKAALGAVHAALVLIHKTSGEALRRLGTPTATDAFALTSPPTPRVPASLEALEPAEAHDLDSEHGDPVIKFVPKFWKGGEVEGKRLSECSPADLRAYAADRVRYARWQDEQGKEDKRGEPASRWSLKDAARALGWAKRLEASAAASTPAQRPLPWPASDVLAGPGEHADDPDGFAGGAL